MYYSNKKNSKKTQKTSQNNRNLKMGKGRWDIHPLSIGTAPA